MRIAYYIVEVNQPVGGVRIIFEQANCLAEKGHKVEIWTLRDTLSLPFRLHNKVTVLKKDPLQLENNNLPDVLILTSFMFVLPTQSLMTRRIWYTMAEEDVYLDLMGQSFIKESEFKLALAQKVEMFALSGWLVERLKSVYKRPSVSVPAGVDTSFFRKTKPLFTHTGPVVFMVCDDLVPWEGTAEGIGAIRLLSKEIPNLKLALVCLDPPRVALDGLDTAVFMRPDQKSLVGIYSSADVFVLPSWTEGFGLSGLEAMACGTPLVTADSGGVREYAINGKNAVMVPPRNPEALAAGIKRVLSDSKLRKRIVQNGLKTAKKLSWERSAKILEQKLIHNSKD